jgi:hypothetical protein
VFASFPGHGFAGLVLALLTLSTPALQDGFAPLDIASGSGHYRAEVRKAPGQERVNDALARWRLNVYSNDAEAPQTPVWSCMFAHRAGARVHRLSDDGQSLLVVEPTFSASRALVRVWGAEAERFSLTAAQLDFSPRRSADEAPPWLKGEGDGVAFEWHETPRGPVQFARLDTLEGPQRWIDLATGEVRSSARFETSVAVVPDAALAEVNVLAPPFVNSFECAAKLHWGEVLEVEVSGSHPTPNWRNVGFQFRWQGDEPRELVLLPMSSPPPANSPQLQVLQGYHATARVVGLSPGRYLLRVEGRGEEHPPAHAIEVLPARPALALRTTGGIMGMERSVRLYLGGVAIVESARPARERRIVVLAPRQVARMEDLLRMAERESAPGPTAVSDAVGFELRWRSGERDHVRQLWDPGAVGAAGELARLLQALHD